LRKSFADELRNLTSSSNLRGINGKSHNIWLKFLQELPSERPLLFGYGERVTEYAPRPVRKNLNLPFITGHFPVLQKTLSILF
jgi:hypothetical protein